MAAGDFLARIKLIVEGQAQAVANLKTVEKTVRDLTGVPVQTVFSKEGLATGKQLEGTIKGVGKETGTTARQMGDFERALRRVVVVAPVWMAFRAVLQETFALIKDGFRTWVEFDRQLIKSKAVVHDFAGTTDEAMRTLEDSIRTFSRESGIALNDLASSFYRFGTVGIAFEQSLSGAIASAKLARATLGDVDVISRSLAQTYRLLGDTIDNSLSPMQQQESLAGKILHLWRTNAFEANEFAASLGNFVSTANIANFTTDQTIALLAALGTAGVQGARGGRLLRTAIQKLIDNLDELAPRLGLSVNPELENTFDLFLRVLRTINKLSEAEGIPAEALESISKIFGGVRGGQVISALNALLPEFEKNLIDLGKNPQEFIKGLNDRFKEVTDTVSGQLDIFGRLREQVGEAFVKGITGAEDFKNALITINTLMEQMILVSEAIGAGVRGAFDFTAPIRATQDLVKHEEEFRQKVIEAESGLSSLKDTIALVAKIESDRRLSNVYKDMIPNIKETIRQLAINGQIQANVNKMIEEYNKNVIQVNKSVDKGSQSYKNLLREISLEQETSKESLEIIKLQKQGYDDSAIILAKLNQEVTKIVNQYNSLDRVIEGTLPKLDAQTVLTKILNRDWEGVIASAKGNVSIVNELTNLAKTRNQLELAVAEQYIKQDEAIKSQYINYVRANEFERQRIRRLLELQQLEPEELARAFENTMYDENLIIDYWSSFTREGQEAINEVIRRLYDLPTFDLEAALGGLNFSRQGTPGGANINQTLIGAQNLSVNVSVGGAGDSIQDIAELIAQMVKEGILKDVRFQDAWGNLFNIERE